MRRKRSSYFDFGGILLVFAYWIFCVFGLNLSIPHSTSCIPTVKASLFLPIFPLSFQFILWFIRSIKNKSLYKVCSVKIGISETKWTNVEFVIVNMMQLCSGNRTQCRLILLKKTKIDNIQFQMNQFVVRMVWISCVRQIVVVVVFGNKTNFNILKQFITQNKQALWNTQYSMMSM